MAAGAIERVQIMLQAFTKGFGKNLVRAQTQLKKVGKDINNFGEVMRMPIDNLKQLDGRFKVMKSSGGKFAFTMRNLTHGMRGFRMEMLGIMFFGMALTRIFTSLTRTSMEWMGTTEILSSALGLLFLPVAEKMTNWVLKFLDWVDKLTEKQKKWIGNIFLTIGVIGLIITAIGTLALGIGSLILVFGGFGAAIAAMTLIGAVIIGIGLIVTGVVKLINGKLEGIGLVIMGIGFILFLFIGWWALIPIAVGAAIYLIIKNWNKVKGFLKNTFSVIGGWFKKWFWDKPKSWISSLWNFMKGIFGKIKNLFKKSLLGKAFSFVGGLLGSFQTGGTVPQTGPYLLHRGETVVPTGQTNNNVSPTINISANISSSYDVRRLAEELKRYWVSDFERVSQGRTV